MSKWFAAISLVGIATVMFFTAAFACNSGIQANVTLGPTCPVERPGMRCERPYEARIGIYTESGRFLKNVRTAANGRLRVNLSPGSYVLKPQPRDLARPYPRAKPVVVIVKAGAFTTVEIQYDTGIR